MRFPFAALICLCFSLGAFAQQPTKQEKQDLAKLAKLQKHRDALKERLQKHPNAKLKSEFVAINDKLAYTTMMTDGLTPHQKYATALRDYRFSLKVDPKDPQALRWVHEIESIYRQMHRPIPR